jgi:ATP-dependent protease ClpP protease subunit
MNQPINPNYVLTFVGPINYPASKNLRNACCAVVSQGCQNLIVQISSIGGATNEGFALYYFLKSLPITLTMHNIGSIESIANIVFLAGTHRRVSQHAHFMFHNILWTYGAQQSVTKEQMHEHSLSLKTDETRFEKIFVENTALTEKDFKKLNFFKNPYIMGADFAKEKGIVHEITDAKIPAGWACLNIDY